MNRATWLSRLFKTLVCVCLLAALGCGSDGERVYPVSGEVFVNGEPAVGAEVTFHQVQPDKENPHYPTAIVAADGSFELTTFRAGDGAPAGDYKVTIVWREVRRQDGDTVYGADWLRERHANPATTTLQATVKPEKNVVPRFDLKK